MDKLKKIFGLCHQEKDKKLDMSCYVPKHGVTMTLYGDKIIFIIKFGRRAPRHANTIGVTREHNKGVLGQELTEASLRNIRIREV